MTAAVFFGKLFLVREMAVFCVRFILFGYCTCDTILKDSKSI